MTLAMGNLLRVAATVLPFLATFNRKVGWRKHIWQLKGLQIIHTETVSDWFSQNKIKVSEDDCPSFEIPLQVLPLKSCPPNMHFPVQPDHPDLKKTLVIARKKREVQSRIELREGRLLLAEPKRLSRHKRIHHDTSKSQGIENLPRKKHKQK